MLTALAEKYRHQKSLVAEHTRLAEPTPKIGEAMKAGIDRPMAEKGSAVRWAGFELSCNRAMRHPPEFPRDVA